MSSTSTPISTPRSYETTFCYKYMTEEIDFIDSIISKFLGNCKLINKLYPEEYSSDDYNETEAYINDYRNTIVKNIRVKDTNINTLFNRLSCENYCTLNGDAIFDNNNKTCSCPSGFLIEEFKYSDIPRIYLAQCRKSFLDNFMKQLRLVEDIINGYDDKFKKRKLIVKSYTPYTSPTLYDDYSNLYTTPYATPYS